jgi:hypothetical protein
MKGHRFAQVDNCRIRRSASTRNQEASEFKARALTFERKPFRKAVDISYQGDDLVWARVALLEATRDLPESDGVLDAARRVACGLFSIVGCPYLCPIKLWRELPLSRISTE